MRKILVHPLHQFGEAAKCHDLWGAHIHLQQVVHLSIYVYICRGDNDKFCNKNFTDHRPELQAAEPADHTCPGHNLYLDAATRNYKDNQIFYSGCRTISHI